MRREQSELTNQLAFVIKDIGKKGMFQQVYDKATKEDGLYLYFTPYKITTILQDSMPTHTLSVSDLYNLSLFFVKNGLLNINLDDYFLEKEIMEAISDKRRLKEKYSGDITIKNVLFNGDELNEEYITMMSYKEIAQIYDEGRWIYNFSTQRKANVVKIKGRTERIADVNMNSVLEMKEKMKEKDFHMNAITINMRVSGKEKCEYIDTTGELVIKAGTELDIIDGYHRTKAIHMAWKENPRIEGKMVIIIKHLTVKQARDYIAQEAKGNVNSMEDMRLYDSSSAVAKMIDLINRNNSNGNMLKNKISVGDNTQDTFIYYDIFAKSLDDAWGDIFKTCSSLTLSEISEFICDFYTMVYELICKRMGVKSVSELNGTPAMDMMLMSGFLFPAAQMYLNEESINVKKLKEIANKVDLETVEDNKYSYVGNDRYNFAPYKIAWQNI